MDKEDGSVQVFPGLKVVCSEGAEISPVGENVWRLQLPPGGNRNYRLAQLDDYHHLPRSKFRWQAGCSFQLRARASAQEIPGTWGFGYWNDPFSMGILGSNSRLRWAELPQTAWFFFASTPNFLSIRDDLPGRGNLAMTYTVPGLLSKAAYLGLPALPFLLVRPIARLVRRLLNRLIKQDACELKIDPTDWHVYRISWEMGRVVFHIDNQAVFETRVSPLVRLGFVLWIDNQYAAFTPQGRLGYGFLPDAQPAWIEIADLVMEEA